jgi:hypothetical protein
MEYANASMNIGGKIKHSDVERLVQGQSSMRVPVLIGIPSMKRRPWRQSRMPRGARRT